MEAKNHSSKRSDRVWVSFSLPLDARDILLRVVGENSRVHGQFIARLLYEYQARKEALAAVAGQVEKE